MNNELVLLPGWGFSTEVFKNFSELLNPFFQVTCLNLPGYGTHDLKEIPNTFDEYVKALIPFLPQKAIFFGWSLGGLVAMRLARLFPEKCFSVVTLGSTPCFVEQEHWPGVSPSVFNAFYQEVIHATEKAAKQFCGWLAPQLSERTLYKKLLSLMDLKSKPILQGTLNFLKEENHQEEWKNPPCATLHLYGEKDALVPASLTTHGEFTGTSLLIQEAGHVAFESHGPLILHHLRVFCHVS